MASHRKHRSDDEYDNEMNSTTNSKSNSSNDNDVNTQNTGLDFSNIDMGQLSNLLNNVDLSQLSSLFGSMNMGPSGSAAPSGLGDRRIQLLNAVKPLVPSERADIIDLIMQIYTISKILKR